MAVRVSRFGLLRLGVLSGCFGTRYRLCRGFWSNRLGNLIGGFGLEAAFLVAFASGLGFGGFNGFRDSFSGRFNVLRVPTKRNTVFTTELT